MLEEGSRKFNEECDRLGISRVIAIDGKPALYHADGIHTFLPDDIAATIRAGSPGTQTVDLRETERLSAKHHVRDARSGRALEAAIDRGPTQHAVLRRAG